MRYKPHNFAVCSKMDVYSSLEYTVNMNKSNTILSPAKY